MKIDGRKVHIIKDPKLRKIRYNLRALLWCEFRMRMKSIFEKKEALGMDQKEGKISSEERWKKSRELDREQSKLIGAMQGSPINCIRCKSVKNDLQQDKWGGYECYKRKHELDERLRLRPTSPFDEDLTLWGEGSPLY
ncbi:MAG: hypothetical protein BAJALOKI3v1_1110002 [Promethearchaeota archaeon]|nr:MAG: hypothetical protein BAJALOKI3v1_1110002 [Candidatus Lokiarchaeota archaeon]